MRLTLLILIVNIGYSQKLLSQNQMSNWFFGDSIWIQFTEDTPEVSNLAVDFLTGTNYNYNIISDSTGNLILYKDAYHIYDSSGNILNSTFLLNLSKHSWSSIFIPTFDSITPFVIVYLDDDSSRLHYCKVGYNIDDGSWFIPEEMCNITLDEGSIGYMAGRLTIIRHGNGRDWWVVNKVHSIFDSLQPFSVRLFDGYEFAEPIYYYIDSNLDAFYFQHGQMIASENGDWILLENGKDVKIYNFDRCSGLLELYCQVSILANNYLLQSVAFSQSGKYIYVSSEGADEGGVNGISKIWQFDLTGSSNCADFEASKKLIYQEPESYYGWDIGEMLLERYSGRIYFSIIKRLLEPGDDTIKAEQNLHLHAILEPDLMGASSNVQENVLYLNGFVARAGLPNMPNYALGTLQGSPCDTIDTTNNLTETLLPVFEVYPNPISTFLQINNPMSTSYTAVVFNTQGELIQRWELSAGNQTLSVSHWPSGSYALVVYEEDRVVWRATLLKMEQ